MRNSQKIEEGEVVKLKSGGPLMTTGFTDDYLRTECYWFDEAGVFHKELIIVDAIVKVDEGDK